MERKRKEKSRLTYQGSAASTHTLRAYYIMSGWICLHRPILKHWVYKEPEALKFWVTLLMDANWEPKTTIFNKKLITVGRGQIVFGRKVYSLRLDISEMKLRRYLKLLEKDGMINQQITNKYTLITVLQYDQYQDNNQQVTSKQPASNQRLTTSKQVNNITIEQKDILPAKAVKKKTSLKDDFILTKHKAGLANTYWEKKGRSDLDVREIFEQFTTYCRANGKRFADWNAAWQTWYVNAVKFERGNANGNNRKGYQTKSERADAAAIEALRGI